MIGAVDVRERRPRSRTANQPTTRTSTSTPSAHSPNAAAHRSGRNTRSSPTGHQPGDDEPTSSRATSTQPGADEPGHRDPTVREHHEAERLPRVLDAREAPEHDHRGCAKIRNSSSGMLRTTSTYTVAILRTSQLPTQAGDADERAEHRRERRCRRPTTATCSGSPGRAPRGPARRCDIGLPVISNFGRVVEEVEVGRDVLARRCSSVVAVQPDQDRRRRRRRRRAGTPTAAHGRRATAGPGPGSRCGHPRPAGRGVICVISGTAGRRAGRRRSTAR